MIMGEDIEIRDINGNLVRVPLYPTLAAIGSHLQEGETVSVRRTDGLSVEVKLARDNAHDVASMQGGAIKARIEQ